MARPATGWSPTDGNHLTRADRLAGQAQAAAAASGAPSALAVAAWVTGEIAAITDPGPATEHLQRAAELATSVGNRLVAGLAEVSLAGLHARYGERGERLDSHQVIDLALDAIARAAATASSA